MDLISSQYGWTDDRILGHTLARLAQIVAAIQRRQWLDDLTHRRLETAKLRNLCAYIAATMQLGEGDSNVMLDEAMRLSLGTGTEAPGHDDTAAAAERPAPAGPGSAAGPRVRVNLADLPDAPPTVRAGQHSAHPAGINPIPAERLAGMLGGPR